LHYFGLSFSLVTYSGAKSDVISVLGDPDLVLGADIAKILEICINVLNQGSIQCAPYMALVKYFLYVNYTCMHIIVELKMIQDV